MGINPSDLLSGNMLPPATATQASSAPTPTTAPPISPDANATSAQQSIQNFNTKSAVRKKGNTLVPTAPKPEDEENKEKDKPPIAGPIESPTEDDKFTEGVNKWFSKISVGSGLAIAFFALIVLLWLLVPTASGYTRAQLLWFTLWGQTKLTTEDTSSTSGSPDTSPNPGQSPQKQPLNLNPVTQPVNNGNSVSGGPSLDFSGFDSLSIGEW